MRRLPLMLVTLALVAPVRAEDGEVIRDKRSGLVVKMPEQWSREKAREKGSIRFSAIYDLNSTKYVLFAVETGPSTGFTEQSWLDGEKAAAMKYLKSVDVAWSTEPVTVGGVRATRYSIGGKANGEKDYDLRLRGCGFVHNDVFFRIQEISYNKCHDEAAAPLKAIWESVSFEEADPFASDEEEEGCGEEEEEPGTDSGAGNTPQGEPTLIEDKAGNFKITALPGWEIDRAPSEDENAEVRIVLKRVRDNGDILLAMEIFRLRWDDSEVFTTEEPGDFLIKKLGEQVKFFEPYYGENSAKLLRPEIDVRTQLGKADKSCAYEIRNLTMDEEKKIAEAQALINRGDMSVKLPEFDKLVTRGRIAMISPYIYVTRSVWFARSFADNEQILAEFNQILDSWEFESTEGRPPPLLTKDGPLGDTTADPKNKTERKETIYHDFKKGAKVEERLKVDLVLPPGFQLAEAVQDEAAGGMFGGEDVVLQVVAQNDNNGWVWIRMVAINRKSLGPNTKFEEKQTTFETWISNFSSLARNTGKLPKKPEKISVGNLRGDGCELEGKINNFRASELNMVTIEGGWWIRFEMKTRGGGRVDFADEIKTFLKKLKATKK